MPPVSGNPIPIATARELVTAAVMPLPAERVDISTALGRVLAREIRADRDLPPFASSAMDGYAVRAGPERTLEIVDESRAGHPATRALGDGEAIAVSTGAELPAGTEAVVPIEACEPAAGGVRVPAVEPGAHVRGAGEDIRAGTVVMGPGRRIGPAELGVLAELGRVEVECGRRPRVAVLATGDELVAPGEPLGPGQIHDSNAYALAAQAQLAGAEVVFRGTVPDDPERTAAALAAALAEADVVCVSGGVSVGPHDHVKPALAELGVEEIFWRVSMKPGKPVWFGVRERTLVFGLPGNPVSAMVTFHTFARPALHLLAGGKPHEPHATAVLDQPLARLAERDQIIRCRLRGGELGWYAEPTREQGSHVLTSMLGADAFAFVPAGDGELPAGARVDIELLLEG